MKSNNNEEGSSSAEGAPKRPKIAEYPSVSTITQCPPLPNPFEQEVFDAVDSGDLSRTISSLNYVDDMLLSIDDALGPKKLTALHIAASKGFTDICRVLIQKGAKVNLKCQGVYPLNLAAYGNHIDTCSMLIKLGAEVNLVSDLDSSSHGRTPLQDAACRGSVELIRALISNGAHINTKAGLNITTALHFAVGSERLLTVNELLNHKADVNAQNKYGQTPLDLAEFYPVIFSALVEDGAKFDPRCLELRNAVKEGNTEACLQIISQGCDVNVAGGFRHDTPLMLAAYRGYAVTCKALLENRASLDFRDKDGSTPLRAAMSPNNIEILHLFMNEVFNNRSADSAIYREYLVTAVEIGDMGLCRRIIDKSSLGDNGDESGQTLLHIAAYYQQVEVCELLIQLGADLNARDSQGETPLFLALHSFETLDNSDYKKVEEIFYMMIDQGADISTPHPDYGYEYYTPLSLIFRDMDYDARHTAIPRAIFFTTYYNNNDTHGFLGALSNDDYAALCAKTLFSLWVLNKLFRLPLPLCHIIFTSNSDLRMDILMILMRRIVHDWEENGYIIQKKSMQGVPIRFHPLVCHGIFSNTIRELKCMYKKFGHKNSNIVEQEYGESIMSNIKDKLGVMQESDVSPGLLTELNQFSPG